MRDVLGKMRECGKYIKMRDFPLLHDCGMVDTYAICEALASANLKHLSDIHSVKHSQSIGTGDINIHPLCEELERYLQDGGER